MANCEIPQEDGWSKPTAIHGPFGLTFHPLEKAITTAVCLENQFKPHDLCHENHKQQMEARVQTLLKAVDNNSSERIRPCDIQKLVNSLKLRKGCRIDGNPKMPQETSKKTFGTLNVSD
jgi:hypothetical protein